MAYARTHLHTATSHFRTTNKSSFKKTDQTKKNAPKQIKKKKCLILSRRARAGLLQIFGQKNSESQQPCTGTVQNLSVAILRVCTVYM